MIARSISWCIAALSLGVFSGCGAHAAGAAEPPFSVVFSAVTDEGDPLSGVTFALGQQGLGTTDTSGKTEHLLVGTEGQTLALSVSCPPGFESDEAPAAVRLTRTHRVGTGEPEPLAYRTTCTRRVREIVVVVRSERGQGLPVEIDGKAASVTSADGTAHVLVRLDRNVRTVDVRLDTQARLDLRPQNPLRTFELTGRDAVLIFEQSFATILPPSPRRTAVHARHIPYRVD